MSRYVNVPPISSGIGTGWAAERWAVAIDRLPTLNRWTATDLDDGGFFLGGGAQVPTLVTTKSGGVYAATGTNGYINIGKTDSLSFIAAPQSESWYVAARVCNPAAAAFTAATFNVPIGLASAAGALYVEGRAATSTTVYQLNMFSGAADHFNSLGSVATLGSATCPVGSFYVASMYFNATSGVLTVEFSDTVADTFSGAELTNMISDPCNILSLFSSDTTMDLQCDSMFYAHVAP